VYSRTLRWLHNPAVVVCILSDSRLRGQTLLPHTSVSRAGFKEPPLQTFSGREAFFRFDLEHWKQHTHMCGDVFNHFRKPFSRIAFLKLIHGQEMAAFRSLVQYKQSDHADCPNIHLGRLNRGLKDLRCNECRTSGECVTPIRRFRESEICKIEIAIVIVQDVVQLDISMNHVFLVKIYQCVQHLVHQSWVVLSRFYI
jgi:hypothetical protein